MYVFHECVCVSICVCVFFCLLAASVVILPSCICRAEHGTSLPKKNLKEPTINKKWRQPPPPPPSSSSSSSSCVSGPLKLTETQKKKWKKSEMAGKRLHSMKKKMKLLIAINSDNSVLMNNTSVMIVGNDGDLICDWLWSSVSRGWRTRSQYACNPSLY